VVKLMDFGIAKAAADRKLTMTGTTMGSLYYMSPEQIQGSASLDARSDLYSVGVTLYELVTGKRPFDGDSQFSIMSAHLQSAPTPPIALDPKLPQALNDIILLSVAKDPAQRFQTAGAFRNALSNVAPAAAKPAPVAAAPQLKDFHLIEPTAPAKPGGRRGLWMALGAVAVIAVLIAVVQFGPWTHAAPKALLPAAQPEVVAAPVPAPAAVTPPVEQPAVVSQTPVVAPPSSKQPVGETPRTVEKAAQPRPVTTPAAPPQQPVVQAQPLAASTQPPAQAQAAAAVNTPNPNRAELMQMREQLAMLGTRAGGIRSSLQTLQRSQAASGLNLRGDMQEAAGLMTTYLEGSNSALNAGDAASAKSFLDKAERQIEKLEKFLNR
jgi:serine/threonine-protein kinase